MVIWLSYLMCLLSLQNTYLPEKKQLMISIYVRNSPSYPQGDTRKTISGLDQFLVDSVLCQKAGHHDTSYWSGLSSYGDK